MSDDQAGAARKPIAFISHHNSQEKVARHVKAVFERNGVIGWMAPDDIEPGLQFDRAIIEQVKKSDIIVLLFCAQSDQSKHVKREIMLAEDQDKLIYPVRLEAIEPSGLAYWLQDYQWIDWVDRRDATIERMLATVKRQVAARDAANPPVVEDGIAPGGAGSGAIVEPPSSGPPDGTVTPPAPPPATAAIVAGPAMSAPMPLVSGGDVLATSPGGDGDGVGIKQTIAAFARRIDRNGWIAVGVIGLLLAVLIGIAVANPGGSTDSSRDDDDFVIEPGMWARRLDNIVITFPPLAPDVADERIREIRDYIELEACVGDGEARDPGVRFFDPDGQGNCEIDNLVMEDGDLAADLTCRAVGGDEEIYTLRGGFGDTSAEGDLDAAFAPGTPNEIRFTGRWTNERIGQCD